MNKKVTLTIEQAQALEAALKKESADAILKTAATDYETWFNECHALNYMDLPTIAKALYAGYEVEPGQSKFQPGDKVFLQSGDSVPRILTLRENDKPFRSEWTIQEALGCIHERYFRHATPEEIYWLETLGREKISDFRKDDVFVGHDGSFFILNEIDGEDARIWYKDRAFKGLYPAESFKPFPKEESE